MLMGCLVCVCSAFALAQHEAVVPGEPLGPPGILARRDVVPEPDPIVAQLEADARKSESRSSALQQLAEVAEDTTRNRETRIEAVKALGRSSAVEVQDRLRELSRFPATANTAEEFVAYDVASAAQNAYWQVELSKQTSEEDRLDLLRELSRNRLEFFEEHGHPRSSSYWVVDQLVAYEDPELLPHIAEAFRVGIDEDYKARPGQELRHETSRYMVIRDRILGFAAHMKVHGDRFEALKAFMNDPYGHEPEDDPRRHLGVNHFTVWAVREIFELDTAESRWYLLGYARGLQERFHDERGEAKVPQPPGDFAAFMAYRNIVWLLSERAGWTRDDFAELGLYPDRYFLMI